jgi:uncharacterized membrane protein YbaN (DUF454 family)
MKWLFLAIGGITVVTGLFMLLLPIPLGIPLLLVGTPLLMRYSRRTRAWILKQAERSPGVHEFLLRIPSADQDKHNRRE